MDTWTIYLCSKSSPLDPWYAVCKFYKSYCKQGITRGYGGDMIELQSKIIKGNLYHICTKYFVKTSTNKSNIKVLYCFDYKNMRVYECCPVLAKTIESNYS